MTDSTNPRGPSRRWPGDADANGLLWLVLGIGLLLSGASIFATSFAYMVQQWTSAEYSHAWLIPVVSLFIVWYRRHVLSGLLNRGSWFGTAVLAVALALCVLGEFSTIFALQYYGFVLALAGLTLAAAGGGGLRLLWFPIAYLVFMVPLPNFLQVKLSQDMQLISSFLGVEMIRWTGVSVFLSGNVIDLGAYKLQVVEACSGLRYLFPLMSFGFLVAYLFRGAIWQRTLLFLSTIPITVAMNSLRIAVIGILVEYYGVGAAEGFLHYFEGWSVFLVCLAALCGEAWILVKLNDRKGRLADYVRLETGRLEEKNP